MSPLALAVFAAALLAQQHSFAAAAETNTVAAAEGLSLAEMSRIVEAEGYPLSELFGAWTDPENAAEGRGKKPKPGQMAMMMAGTAAMSMMMMKAMGAIKLFIVHSFFATKLGLLVGAYLLACKLMEMKQPPPKKVIKWVPPPPPAVEEHPSWSPSMMVAQQISPADASYEPSQQDGGQQQQLQYGGNQQQQYGPPPAQQQQFMPSGDFGGGDLQAHYSHVSPVTYRPTVNRVQSDKSVAGRKQLRKR